jgi:SAM-dependent methyltransferase
MQWFNDAEFWERFAPIMFDDARWGEVTAVAGGLSRLAGFASQAGYANAACLEQCCGFGRIALEMARRGFDITGVDITPAYLETARGDAAYEKLQAEFILEDVRSFRRPGAFDLVYNVYISFGYFEDPQDDALVIRNAYDSLKSGGTFVLETLGREIAKRDFIKGEWFERGGYYVLTAYESLDAWKYLKNRWILIDQKAKIPPFIIEKNFTQRLYSASGLRQLFLNAGFLAVETYGGWNGEPYGVNAKTLIVTGKKGFRPQPG